MAAYSTAYYAVAAHEYVDIEVDVNLKSRQDNDVEIVCGRTLLLCAGIFVGSHLFMACVVLQRFGSHLVERLHVDESLNESLLVHFDHVGCDAAQCERGLDVLVNHALADILYGSERSTAGASLYGEALTEVTTGEDHLGSLLGEQDVAWILGVAYCT